MGATTLTGIVTKAGFMAKTVTMTVAKVKTHPKLHKVCILPPCLTTRHTCVITSISCMTPSPHFQLVNSFALRHAVHFLLASVSL